MKKIICILIIIWLSQFNNLLSAQEFIVGDTAGSFITYSNIPDTSLPLNYQSYSEFRIDIDFDQEYDIRFYRYHTAGQLSTLIKHLVYSLDSVQFACTSSAWNADTLSIGSILNVEQNWNNNFDGALLFEGFYSQIPPSYEKGLFRKDSLFLGFRKIYQSDTLYGWFFVDCTPSAYVIRSFAIDRSFSNIYEDREIEEVKIYPNPAFDLIKIRITLNISDPILIKIFNSSGVFIREYLHSGNHSVNHEINLNIGDLRSGIYFIHLQIGEKLITEKIIKL